MTINKAALERQIDDIVRPLGVTRRGTRRVRFLKCMFLICEDEDRLCSISKEIYSVVGKSCGCSADAVGHSIHDISVTAWNVNRPYLQELAVYPLDGPPSAADFLEIIYNHLARRQADQAVAPR